MNQVLNIVSVDNYEQIVNNVDYAAFKCTHASTDKELTVLVTKNLLRKKGIGSSEFDYMSDTRLILKDSVDLKTGEITSPEEQIRRVVDGDQLVRNGVPQFRPDGTEMKYELIFVNSVTGDILKGDLLKAETQRSSDNTKAAVLIRKEEARFLAAQQRRAEARALGIAPAKDSAEKTEEKPSETPKDAGTPEKSPEVITLNVDTPEAAPF